jgi:hypothetical protein
MIYLMRVRSCDYEESKGRDVEGGGRCSILSLKERNISVT